MKNDLTVLIPTYNRKRLLRKTLLKLKSSLKLSFLKKVVVITNYERETKLPYKHKKLELKNFNKGLLEMKNEAITNINTKWVLVLDDDLEFKEGLIGDLYKKISTYEFDMATGLLVEDNKYSVPDPLFLFNYCQMSFYGVGSLNYKKATKKNPYRADFLPGCFLLSKTSLLKKLKYDSAYLFPFFNEDTDITYRAKKLKKCLLVFKDIKAVHLRSRQGGNRKKIQKDKWFYAFGFNNSYFINKNFGIFTYFMYSLLRIRDHLFVLRQFNLKVLIKYIKGIVYGYEKATR